MSASSLTFDFKESRMYLSKSVFSRFPLSIFSNLLRTKWICSFYGGQSSRLKGISVNLTSAKAKSPDPKVYSKGYPRAKGIAFLLVNLKQCLVAMLSIIIS